MSASSEQTSNEFPGGAATSMSRVLPSDMTERPLVARSPQRPVWSDVVVSERCSR